MVLLDNKIRLNIKVGLKRFHFIFGVSRVILTLLFSPDCEFLCIYGFENNISVENYFSYTYEYYTEYYTVNILHILFYM